MRDALPATLILVDDDEHVLAALKFAFEVEGFEVRAYPCAESLLAEPRLPQSGCLILDYNLPGLDGLELLRLRGVTMPAVVITTPGPSILARAAACGGSGGGRATAYRCAARDGAPALEPDPGASG